MIALRKLPARYAPVVMPLVLSILMTFVVSGLATLRSLGLTPAFVATWPAAWACPGWWHFQPCLRFCRWCGGSYRSWWLLRGMQDEMADDACRVWLRTVGCQDQGQVLPGPKPRSCLGSLRYALPPRERPGQNAPAARSRESRWLPIRLRACQQPARRFRRHACKPSGTLREPQ